MTLKNPQTEKPEATIGPLYADNPELWRKRAEEARAQAEQMYDAASRRMMREIAEGYDRMAERALARMRHSS